MLPFLPFLQRLYWRYFAGARSDRPLYRSLLERPRQNLLVMGIGHGERVISLVQLAKKQASDQAAVRLICLDPFEGRTPDDGPGLSLRKAHKILAATGATVHCIPGSPEISVAQLSRTEKGIEWVLIATPSLDWLGVRGELLLATLAEDVVVFLEQDGAITAMTREELKREIASRRSTQRKAG